MKLISWNVNGLRAVERKKELENLIKTYDPDVLLIQETKMQIEQAKPFLEKYTEYEQYYHQAEKKGYSGVSTWIKKDFKFSPLKVRGELKGCYDKNNSNISIHYGMPNFDDSEGRILRTDIGDYSIINIYFPNGGKSPEAWDGKMKFYERFLQYINQLKKEGKKVIWAGDVNCAHEEIDLARPKDNMKSIGFLPEERAWVSKVIANGWADVFRTLHPTSIIYSWWHVITRARERNVGWRIDYFFVEQSLISHVKNIEYLNSQMGSDHCPVALEIDI